MFCGQLNKFQPVSTELAALWPFPFVRQDFWTCVVCSASAFGLRSEFAATTFFLRSYTTHCLCTFATDELQLLVCYARRNYCRNVETRPLDRRLGVHAPADRRRLDGMECGRKNKKDTILPQTLAVEVEKNSFESIWAKFFVWTITAMKSGRTYDQNNV